MSLSPGLCSKYPNQPGDSTDAFAVYAFKKLVPDEDFTYHPGPVIGTLGAPKHGQLSLTPQPESVSTDTYSLGQKVGSVHALINA